MYILYVALIGDVCRLGKGLFEELSPSGLLLDSHWEGQEAAIWRDAPALSRLIVKANY